MSDCSRDKNPGHFPVYHICVDVQEDEYCDLKGDRTWSFPWSIGRFSKRLRKLGIPTLWVKGTSEHHHDDAKDGVLGLHRRVEPWSSDSSAKKRDEPWMRSIGPEGQGVRRDEDAFLKTDASPFADTDADGESKLTKYLRSMGVQTVVVSGMNTSACITKTINDAVKSGFSVVVMSDLLADSTWNNHEGANGGDPRLHINTVRTAIRSVCETMKGLKRFQLVTFFPENYLCRSAAKELCSNTPPNKSLGAQRPDDRDIIPIYDGQCFDLPVAMPS